MRKILILVSMHCSLFTALPQVAIAQSDMIDGMVTNIDTSASKITIKHGPMKKLDMDEGMTMIYRIQDPAMLTTVKAGDTVKFDAEYINGQFIVTKIQRVK
jgi:Cu(I)/Ag(I) efflux system protein CusF